MPDKIALLGIGRDRRLTVAFRDSAGMRRGWAISFRLKVGGENYRDATMSCTVCRYVQSWFSAGALYRTQSFRMT